MTWRSVHSQSQTQAISSPLARKEPCSKECQMLQSSFGICKLVDQWLSCVAFRIKFWNCNLAQMTNSSPASVRTIRSSFGRYRMASRSIREWQSHPSHSSSGLIWTPQSTRSTRHTLWSRVTPFKLPSISLNSISVRCNTSCPVLLASCQTLALYEPITLL